MQSLAHQVHLCFRAYVRADIKGYIGHFGTNDVIKERVNGKLQVFSGHLMTILGKLVDGMNLTYLQHLFPVQSNEEHKKESPFEGFDRLANQWSMHQISPRTMNMSITSIQSAISKEIMCDPIDSMVNRDLNIPKDFVEKYERNLSPDPNPDDYEECPKTEKMYERLEFLKNAGKARIQNLVFP